MKKNTCYKPYSPSGTTPLKRKGIILFYFLLSAFCFLPSPLTAQPLIYDYNPYECAQEELLINSSAFRERHESDNCNLARELIGKFYNAEARGDEYEQYNLLRTLSYFQCEDVYDFLEKIIKINSSETNRCHALIYLAWMLNIDYLPTVQHYVRKLSLSAQEKSSVATALMIFGVYDAQPHLVEQSLQILNEICDEASEQVLENCVLSYLMSEDPAAINFFSTQMQQEEYQLYAALFLVQMGEYNQTFPIFAAALSSDDLYEVHTAVMGLATIGTEEAIEMILNLDPEKNRYHPKEARWSFEYINFEERR